MAKRRQQGASLLGVIGAILVGIGVALQVVLIWLLLRHAYTPHSEGRGFEGMALMAITFYAAAYILPSTCVAIAMAVGAVARHRSGGGARAASVFYIAATFLPLAVLGAMMYPDPDTRRDHPSLLDRVVQSRVQPQMLGTNRAQMELSGRTFAVDANLLDDSRCSHASPEFEHGCRDQVALRLGKVSAPTHLDAQPQVYQGPVAPAAPSAPVEPPIGERIAEMHEHRTRVSVLEFVGDGDTIASASQDGEVRLTRVASGISPQSRILHERDPRFKPMSMRTLAAAFAPDGRAFVTADDDLLVAHDAASGTESWRERLDSSVVTLAYSHDGRVLAVSHGDQRVSLRDARTGKLLHVLAGHESRPYSLAFSRDGRVFMSAGLDGDVMVWDVATGAQVRRWSRPAHGGLALAALTGDGKNVAVGTNDGFTFWDAASGAEVLAFPSEDKRLAAFAMAPDRSSIATFGSGDAIRIFDPAAGQKRGNLDYMPATNVLAYSRDGRMIAAGDENGRVAVWRVRKQP